MATNNARDVLDGLRTEPVGTLRSIKNSLTGRELRKIEYIEAGLVPAIERFLLSQECQNETNAENETMWADAASIISLLANSGTSFTHPVIKSSVVALLLDRLRALTTPPKLALTLLRCLNKIADNLPLESDNRWNPDRSLTRELYRKDNAACLVGHVRDGLASNKRQTFYGRRVSQTALSLICRTCTADKHRAVLIGNGLLEPLADYLLHVQASTHRDARWRPSSLAGRARSDDHETLTSLVLETICLLVERSNAYARAFIHQQSLGPVFQHSTTANNHAFELPFVPDALSLNAARRSPFPPLGHPGYPSLTPKKRASFTRQDSSAMVIEDSDEDSNTDLCDVSWLLHLARTSRGRLRVMAARLIGILKNHGYLHSARIRSFAALLVPILVNMIGANKNLEFDQDPNSYAEILPSTLALIVRDNENLQNAAVDANAIPKLTAALKANFEAKQDLEQGLWWPERLDHKLTDGEPGCYLGRGGPSRQIRWNMQHREGILQALASIAPTNDAHRKEICDQGALPQIILALEPFGASPTTGAYGDTITIQGNSAETLVAACGAVRALTRSATALRTKLVDAEVAKSILRLLQTADPEVRIAATMVMSNLAYDFSPMKDSISERTVIRKLCEQAHSANARLRHESLFALKALVVESNNDLKRKIVDELGPNWIKQLIATDPHDVPPGEVIGLVPNDYEKGSMLRVSEDSAMYDAVSTASEDSELEDFSRHTLQEDLDIQAELLAFLRNLTTGEHATEIIDYLLEHIGQEDFLQILLDRLQSSNYRRTSLKNIVPPIPPETACHSLYILLHLCAADPKYRAAICSHTTLIKQAVSLVKSPDSTIRTAVCWLINNIVHPTPNDGIAGALQRAQELQKLGVVSELRKLEASDPLVNVVERAKTALDHFNRLLA